MAAERIVGGRYVLKDVLGVGGCGRVFRARDRALDRDVAIKTLRFTDRTAALRDTMRRRLAREAEALDSIDHPNILPLHGRVEVDGEPALVVDIATHGELGEFLQTERGRTLSGRRRLELFADAARGVLAAHREGFVHRDIKPSNVLVTETRGRLHAMVSDFGFVRALDARWTAGLTGQALGTPVYMAPEQHGAADTVDHRADVYALGLLLHVVLGGSTAEGVGAVRASIEARTRPRRIGGVDLDAVILRCTQRDPGRRYAGCHALLRSIGVPEARPEPDFEKDPSRFSERPRAERDGAPTPMAAGRWPHPSASVRGVAAVGLLGTGILAAALLVLRLGRPTPDPTAEPQALVVRPDTQAAPDPACAGVLGTAAGRFTRCEVSVCTPPTSASGQRTASLDCPSAPETACEALWRMLEADGEWRATPATPGARLMDLAGPGGRGLWTCEAGPTRTRFAVVGGLGPPVFGGAASPSPEP